MIHMQRMHPAKFPANLELHHYDKSLQLVPDYADAYYNLGNAYRKKGDYDRAIANYDKFLQLVPNHAYAYYHRGTAYRGKGDTERGAADCAKAQQMAPGLFRC